MTRRLFLGASGFVCAGMAALGAAQYDAPTSRQLAGSTLVDGRSYQYVAELTDSFGSRLTGSRAYERAAEWGAAQFHAAGISRVTNEAFTIAHAWERVTASGRITSPLDQPLHLASLGWMPSTPEGGMEGEVVLVTDISPEHIAAQPSLTGKIALVTSAGGGSDAAERYSRRQHLAERLRAAQAIAMLSPDGEANNVLAARSPVFGSDIGVLPAAQIGHEDAELLKRLLEKGAVRIAIDWKNRISARPVVVNSVVAEIRGRERPDEWVMVGAHLDSWDFATGAQDNGTGVAAVLDAARAIEALGRPPRRSIRFALWGGEEQGLLGSYAYVEAHANDMAQCVANINADGGSGHVRGFLTPGRPDVAEAMRPLSAALLAGLGAVGVDPSMRYAFDSDDGPFILQGIPALDLDSDEDSYEAVHHKSNDTLDKVDRHNLAVGTATVAITAYAIADADQPIAKRLDHAGVAAMLEAARSDRVLQLRGLWNPGG